jgi:hypothetical protein
MLAMKTLARRVHDDRPQTKYNNNKTTRSVVMIVMEPDHIFI